MSLSLGLSIYRQADIKWRYDEIVDRDYTLSYVWDIQGARKGWQGDTWMDTWHIYTLAA